MDIRNISANQITIWIALVIGLALAFVIGGAVGRSDARFVAGAIAVMLAAVIFVQLKTNIWVLLPIGYFLTGRLTSLPLPLSVRDLCFLAVIASFTLFIATRTLSWKRQVSTLDYLVYINLAYLATVYVRNPAGFYAFGSDIVGGRPYFEVLLTFGAFMVLSRVHISDTIAKVLPLFYLIPTSIIAILDAVAKMVPQFSYPLAMIYSGIGSRSMTAGLEKAAEIGQDRITGLKDVGFLSVLALCARYNPITLLSPLFPVRTVLFFTSLLAIFLSGFRATFLAAIVFYILSTVLRGRGKDITVAAGVGILALTIVIALQGTFVQLPLTMQRTLSWLPGDWSAEAVEGAESSSRWRYDMVEWAWNDNTILRNKIWGQGIGFSIDDMNLIANSMLAGEGGASMLGGSDRENFMITGTFHNGPISAIKCVGVVGLTLFSILIIYMAVRAWKICLLTAGSKAFSLALFVGMPVIFFPIQFLVLTGFYEIDLGVAIFSAGMLNLVSNYHTSLALRARSGQRLLVPSETVERGAGLRSVAAHLAGRTLGS